MQKIPTLFVRNPDDRRHVLNEVTPGCEWVMAGEGVPTRKYDGTCVARLWSDGGHLSTEPPTSGPALETAEVEWFARREVRPGKPAPANYVPVETDEVTGKTVGWEPIGQSAFAKFHAEAIAIQERDDREAGVRNSDWPVGTYELVGPKVNGNPEQLEHHELVEHARAEVLDAPRDFDGLAKFLADFEGEGIVWHHPDDRMCKLKKRDLPR